jgi:hypothetical protein
MKNLIILFLLIPFTTLSQNLVLNGSFEDTVACPYAPGQIDFAEFWYTTGSTTDYFHACSSGSPLGFFGYQLPFQGNAYAGIFTGSPTTNTREYVEGTLSTALIAGHCYQLSFYVNAAHYNYTTDAIHAYFSDTLITGVIGQAMFVYNPHVYNTLGNFPDTMNWMLFQQNYVASGGEQYVVIGNLLEFSLSTFIQINNSPSTPGSYMYIDSVSLIEVICTGIEESTEATIAVFPNPTSGLITVSSTGKSANSEFLLHDITGRLILHQVLNSTSSVDISEFPPALYFYELRSDRGERVYGKILKQ